MPVKNIFRKKKFGIIICFFICVIFLLYYFYHLQTLPCRKISDIKNFFLENVSSVDANESVEYYSTTEKRMIALENDPNINKTSPIFLWRRSNDEIFVSYPLHRAIYINYNYYNTNTNKRAFTEEETKVAFNKGRSILKDIKNGTYNLDENTSEFINKYGFKHDELNSISWTEVPLPYGAYEYYYRLAFIDDNPKNKRQDLYTIDINGHNSSNFLDLSASIYCGRPNERYDKFYDSLNLKFPLESINPEENYVKIHRISPDNSVYSINDIQSSMLDSHGFSGHYYFKDGVSSLISDNWYHLPECSILESRKIGKGMFCEEQNAKNRIIRPVDY